MPPQPFADAPPPDGTLADACGDEPGAICEWVWERTSNETLAGIADWLIGRPLSVVFILLVAWLVAKIVRRIVRKVDLQGRRRRPRHGDAGAAAGRAW